MKISENLTTNILEQIPGLFNIVDLNSQIIYTNNYSARAYGFRDKNNARGKGIYDVITNTEVADIIVAQDEKVTKRDARILILDIHAYPDGVERILLSQKMPYKLKGKIQGSIFQGTEINSFTFKKIASFLLKSDQQYYGKSMEKHRSYMIIDDILDDSIFSKRQLDCLFYLLRGFTAKQIAQCLELSHRTVEDHLQKIKEKIDCKSKSELINYAVSRGFLNYIPSKLISNISVEL